MIIVEILLLGTILIFQFVTCRLTKTILLRRDIGPFKCIVLLLRYLGVWVHELSHFFFCLFVGLMPKGIKVRYRDEETGRPNPNGAVRHVHPRTIFQAILISLAPLLVSTGLIYWSLTIAFSEVFTDLYRVLAGLFCVALFLGGSPSNPDLKNIVNAFKRIPRLSGYLVVLLVISVGLSWLVVDLYQWVPPVEFARFIIVGPFVIAMQEYFAWFLVLVFYLGLKFSLHGLNCLYYVILSRNRTHPPRIRYKPYTRRRFKPKHPRKSGIREAPW